MDFRVERTALRGYGPTRAAVLPLGARPKYESFDIKKEPPNGGSFYNTLLLKIIY